ncbi:MAG: hypothetical protein LH478_05050 [Chitinophagaceae bacterium]|nr:hypothetical protein [Chitinophagaceae bacterium]
MSKTWQKITDWEKWPFFLIYTPLVFLWAYYAIRARAFWYFSPVNPTLEFSGFEGECKREMYELMPARYYPATIYIKPGIAEAALVEEVKKAGIYYPLVAKPDRGMQGILFRIIENEEQLKQYHSKIPTEYVVQQFVDLPLEFSAFHVRYPGEKKGRLTGFVLKEYLSVEGDGQSSLLSLIQKNERTQLRLEELVIKHKAKLDRVIPVNEKYFLSYAGNHNRGAKFINLHNEIDDKLQRIFDTISYECKTFFYGRYDLKCTSLEDLKAGKNISILEFNGTGAEPNHIYDCNLTYLQALKEIARHWRHMYKIGRINHALGVPYWGFNKGTIYLIRAKKLFKTLRKYDLETVIA